MEQEADLGRQKLEIATLKRDHDRLLAENGRFSDALGELQSLVQAVSLVSTVFWKDKTPKCLGGRERKEGGKPNETTNIVISVSIVSRRIQERLHPVHTKRRSIRRALLAASVRFSKVGDTTRNSSHGKRPSEQPRQQQRQHFVYRETLSRETLYSVQVMSGRPREQSKAPKNSEGHEITNTMEPLYPPRRLVFLCGATDAVNPVWVCPQNKDQHRRELEWLHPKAAAAETRAVEIEGILDQMNLRLSLFGSSQKRASEEINDLKVSCMVRFTHYPT